MRIILNALAVALEHSYDAVGAERACREALAAATDYGEAWHNLGNILRKLGRPAEAADAHAEAARLLPEHPIVRGALAVALLDLGRLGEALEHFRVRAGLMPGDGEGDEAVLFWRLHEAGRATKNCSRRTSSGPTRGAGLRKWLTSRRLVTQTGHSASDSCRPTSAPTPSLASRRTRGSGRGSRVRRSC